MTGHKGFFYHFLDMKTGAALLAQRAVDRRHRAAARRRAAAQAYFDAEHPEEVGDPRARRRSSTGASTGSGCRCAARLVSMGWKPEKGFIPYDWRGYNEAMLVYAAGARLADPPGRRARPGTPGPTATTARWGRFSGYEHLSFAPLFGHQYSHVWIDFRGIRDAYMRSAASTTSRTAAAPPMRSAPTRSPIRRAGTSYGAERLGLHRLRRPGSDVDLDRPDGPRPLLPRLLGARRRPLGRPSTTAPSRRPPRSSMPFAPEIVDPGRRGDARALRQAHLLAATASSTRSTRSFVVDDVEARPTAGSIPAFGWVATDYLGIDQGPILAMIENYRNGLVWDDDAQVRAAAARPARAGLHRRLARQDGLMPLPRRPAPAGPATAPPASGARLRSGMLAPVARRLRPRRSDPRGPAATSGRWGAKARSWPSCSRSSSRAIRASSVRVAAAAVERGAREAADRLRRRLHCPTSASSATPGCPSSRRSTRSSRSTRGCGRAGIAARRLLRRHPRHQRCQSTAPALGVPWYVDTRLLVLSHATCCAQAGYAEPPRELGRVAGAMRARAPARRRARRRRCCCRSTSTSPLVALALQQGRRCCATATLRQLPQAPASAARSPSTCELFDEGLAPARGERADREPLAGVRARPLRVLRQRPLEHRRVRAPPARASAQDDWATAPLPGARRAPGRVDRRRRRASSIFKRSPRKDAAWQLIEFLSEPDDAAALPRADRRPAAAAQRLAMTPALADDPRAQAFAAAARARARRRRRSRSGSASPARCSSPPSASSAARHGAEAGGRAARRRGRRAPREAPLAAARATAAAAIDRERGAGASAGSRRRRRCAVIARLLRPAGRRRPRAQPHRLRHLRARPTSTTLRFVGLDNYAAAAADAAVLAGARQHPLLRGRRRAALDRPVARRGAAAQRPPRALQGVLPHRAVRAGGDHAGRRRGRSGATCYTRATA